MINVIENKKEFTSATREFLKNKIYVGEKTPTNTKKGDLWFDTSNLAKVKEI